jgi:transcriptional regulator with XRE-family HTH domain
VTAGAPEGSEQGSPEEPVGPDAAAGPDPAAAAGGEARAVASFGERLRRHREQAGLSQAALAGDDLHPSYVSLLESGRRRPTPAAIQVLATRLGLTIEELAGEPGVNVLETTLLAEAALSTGRSAEAVDLLSELVATFTEPRLAADREAYRAAEIHATALERSNDLAGAVARWEVLRQVAETAPARLPWLPAVVALVRCYRDSGDLARAVDLGEQAVARHRALRLEGIDGHAALVSTLAGVYSDRGDHLRAKVLLDGLVTATDAGGPRDDRAYAYWNSAINAAERGYVGEGVRLAATAAALLSEGEDVRSQARVEVTRAWLLLAESPPDAAGARKILRAALPNLRQYAGARTVASAEIELSRSERLLGRAEVARRLAHSALKRLGEDATLSRARALTALGAATVADGDPAGGALVLQEAAAALADAQVPRQAAAVWRQLSAIYRSIGDVERALDAADRAMDGAGLAHEPVADALAGAAAVRTRSSTPSSSRAAPGVSRR